MKLSSARLTACIGALAVLLAGCGSEVPGQPSTSRTSSSSVQIPSKSNDPSSSSQSLGSVDPCSLLTESEAGSLGLDVSGKKDDITPVRDCRWKEPGKQVNVAIRTKGGLSSISENDGETVDTKISGRQAVKQEGNVGCFYFLGVTASSRVDVLGMKEAHPDCELAMKAAKIIAPKLPK